MRVLLPDGIHDVDVCVDLGPTGICTLRVTVIRFAAREEHAVPFEVSHPEIPLVALHRVLVEGPIFGPGKTEEIPCRLVAILVGPPYAEIAV